MIPSETIGEILMQGESNFLKYMRVQHNTEPKAMHTD